jgi:predicted nucleotidyltransferase
MIQAKITLPYEAIAAFCQQHPIRRLSLFGSVLRDDFTPESDVDVLVEFAPNAGVGYFELVQMQIELSAIFGREVDLLTPNALSRQFRERVLSAAQVVYEKE